jgi:hypothetical protein
VLADLDDLLTALYVLVDDLLPARQGASRRPRITAAELITLAVAQILLQCHSERRFLRLARKQLGHLFPYILEQPGHNKRLRSLAPEICQVIAHLARISPSFLDHHVRTIEMKGSGTDWARTAELLEEGSQPALAYLQTLPIRHVITACENLIRYPYRAV